MAHSSLRFLPRSAAAALGLLACLLGSAPLPARSPIFLTEDPALSPDGQTLAFAWRGDIWSVPSTGGVARLLTHHPGRDRSPSFSPDGRQLAFVSDRQAGPQIYLMPVAGGVPQQLTSHSEGYLLEGWYPDGSALLVSAARDYSWFARANQRFFRLPLQPPAGEQLVFDDYGREGDLSPDGQQLLFTREGEEWWRKGYRGSRASQIWLYDLKTRQFQQLLAEPASARSPRWRPDGRAFYFVSARGGSFNLWECDLAAGRTNQLTRFENDAVVAPALSRDGRTIVLRHLFDLYRVHPERKEPPVRLEIWEDSDPVGARLARRTLAQATQVAFADDGLEAAFIAGGDLWVMDTELREPRRVTDTPEEERDPLISPDGQTILFTSDQGGQCDLWGAQRERPELFWWQNERFKLERLTDDAELERDLKWSPAGQRVAFLKGNGDLWTIDPETRESKRVLASWSQPQYQWSPDGKWFVVAREDADFNRDIWILPSDASAPPVNISKHPDNESDPAWSPDGKVVAFTGRRMDTEIDIYFIWLQAEDDARSKRERTLEKAVEKLTKARKKDKPGEEKKAGAGDPGPKAANAGTNALLVARDNPATEAPGAAPPAKDEPARKTKKLPEVRIDWDRIHERVRRVSIPNASEDDLLWSPDSKKLAFSSTVDGKRGTYTVEIPDSLTPKLLSTETGTQGRWLDTGNQIVWLTRAGPRSEPGGPSDEPVSREPGGVPGSLTESGKATNYPFRVHQEIDLPSKFKAAFDLAWRTMRDQWYDDRLGNRNWDEIRRKYRETAAAAPDAHTLGLVINLMLGELNGSHLGFSARGSDPASPEGDWTPVTAHLGVRWDPAHRGPGLRVREVLPDGPADRKTNGLAAGDIVLSVDGTEVDPSMDLARVLNGPPSRDVRLRVRDSRGDDRDVLLRPTTYSAVQPLLYAKWTRDNRASVEALSDGTLGYLHVRGMNWPSFQQFERDLYAAGVGKDGLIIDVRENGGGSTADHLLTALTQPRHAITVPRGGSPGYPQDRMVYATWNKPVVVLCNQNSFSNAEIFSHAIKTLGRGKLVGVPTAGGVISTGGRAIMDVGFLRLPFRGWFLTGTGEDMELNGAVPDHVLWPQPGQMPMGKDVQLEKAVQVLREEVSAWKQRPPPTLRKATQR